MLFRLALILVVCGAAPAMAAGTRLSPAEISYMERTFDACNNSINRFFYDCSCVSTRHLLLAQKMDQTLERRAYDALEKSLEWGRQKNELLRQSYEMCSNTANVAMMAYDQCVEQSIVRRPDFDEFCQCYAVRYADRFAADGTNRFYNDASTRAQAIASCNANPLGLSIAAPIGQESLPSAFK